MVQSLYDDVYTVLTWLMLLISQEAKMLHNYMRRWRNRLCGGGEGKNREERDNRRQGQEPRRCVCSRPAHNHRGALNTKPQRDGVNTVHTPARIRDDTSASSLIKNMHHYEMAFPEKEKWESHVSGKREERNSVRIAHPTTETSLRKHDCVQKVRRKLHHHFYFLRIANDYS